MATLKDITLAHTPDYAPMVATSLAFSDQNPELVLAAQFCVV
jgi:hypothetical protein